MSEFESSWLPRMVSVLRVVAALLFLEHGTQKLFGFPMAAHMPAALTLTWFAGVIEVTGGLLLLVGLFTRAAAFVMSGEMAFSYFIAHFPRSFFPVLNGGDGAVLFCFVFLFFVIAGAGCWSVDAWRGAAKRPGMWPRASLGRPERQQTGAT